MQVEINIDYSDISREAIYDWLDKKAKEYRKKAKKEELEKKIEKKRREEEYAKTPLLIKKLTKAFLRYWLIGLAVLIALVVFDQINNANNFPTFFPSLEAFKNYAFSLFIIPLAFFILLGILKLFVTKEGLGKLKEKMELVRDNSKEIITNLLKKE